MHAVALMHHGAVFARSVDGINTFGLTMALAAEGPELEKQPEITRKRSDQIDKKLTVTDPILGQD